MKAAGHELNGLRALYQAATAARRDGSTSGLAGLLAPLMVVVDYRGWRVVAMCVVPVGDGTLCYGSDDQARTVHRDPQVARLMKDAGVRLNLKEHLVGARHLDESRLTPIVGPCDIEIHRGHDGNLCVVVGVWASMAPLWVGLVPRPRSPLLVARVMADAVVLSWLCAATALIPLVCSHQRRRCVSFMPWSCSPTQPTRPSLFPFRYEHGSAT